jgi:L,D-peptidoglycan transpeptidase YkuD (ErfK/YbiS/YcfS/YnhG family)
MLTPKNLVLANLAPGRRSGKRALGKSKSLPKSLAKSSPGKPAPQKLQRLIATPLPRSAPGIARGRLLVAGASLPCALGGASVSRRKNEGDGASPSGQFRLLGGFYRPAQARPAAPWPLHAIRETDGWCDDPQSPAYNRPLRLPSRYSCERLWRNDDLYDLVIVLDYNLWPRRKGKGSAIFLHCARADFAPTAGCIALRPNDLRRLLPRLAQNAVLVVR